MGKIKTDEKTKICDICFGDYYGYGNNAEPILAGRCCDKCNSIVICARLNLAFRNNPNFKTNGNKTNKKK